MGREEGNLPPLSDLHIKNSYLFIFMYGSVSVCKDKDPQGLRHAPMLLYNHNAAGVTVMDLRMQACRLLPEGRRAPSW